MPGHLSDPRRGNAATGLRHSTTGNPSRAGGKASAPRGGPGLPPVVQGTPQRVCVALLAQEAGSESRVGRPSRTRHGRTIPHAAFRRGPCVWGCDTRPEHPILPAEGFTRLHHSVSHPCAPRGRAQPAETTKGPTTNGRAFPTIDIRASSMQHMPIVQQVKRRPFGKPDIAPWIFLRGPSPALLRARQI